MSQLTAIIESMESGQWAAAIALLVGLLREPNDVHREAGLRLLLAQCLHESGAPEEALSQARQALKTAELTDDRGLIWKCMALISSMEIIDHGRL